MTRRNDHARPRGTAVALRLPLAAAAGALLAALAIMSVAGLRAGAAPADDEPAAADSQDDFAAKSALLQSPRWRRAVFELGEWLSTQKIYSPKEVQKIKAGFNDKVMRMSSQELEYLLDDLEAKFKVMETPEAREARAWVGQYLSAMSDRKRAEVLKDVPNVVEMSAGELSQELEKIEKTRTTLQDRQAAFEKGRGQIAAAAESNRKATAQASNAAIARMNTGPSYSPYRSNSGGGSGGQPPFSNAHVGSGMSLGVGPWGAYVGFHLGNF